MGHKQSTMTDNHTDTELEHTALYSLYIMGAPQSLQFCLSLINMVLANSNWCRSQRWPHGGECF